MEKVSSLSYEVVHTGVKVDMNNLTTQEVSRLIQENGPISYAIFMHEALYGKDGYYSEGKVRLSNFTNKDQEEHGDFITSAEASDIFGGVLASSLYTIWTAMGQPKRFDITEIGAGAGGTAVGLLTWAKELYPDFYEAIQYHIIDVSAFLIEQQKTRLTKLDQEKLPGVMEKMHWIRSSIYDCNFSHQEGAIISNEIPDAAPVDIVRRKGGRLQQKFVDIRDGEWIEVWKDPQSSVLQFIQKYNIKIPEDIEEPINTFVVDFQRVVGTLKRGAVLTMDYGNSIEVGAADRHPVRFYGKGISKEEKENPFNGYKFPGEIDITASVNFRPLIYEAAFKQLSIRYGLQHEMLGDLGARPDLDHMVLKKLHDIKTPRQLIRLYYEIKKLNQISSEFLAVLTSTPGIELPQANHEKPYRTWGFLPLKPLIFRDPRLLPGTKYKIVYDDISSSYVEKVRDNGECELYPPAYLGGGKIVKISSEGEEVILDFSDKALQEEYAQKALDSLAK